MYFILPPSIEKDWMPWGWGLGVGWKEGGGWVGWEGRGGGGTKFTSPRSEGKTP